MNEYELYLQKIDELKRIGLEPHIYGYTTLGLPMYVYKLSKKIDYTKKPIKVLVQAGIHAREYITTFLLFALIEYYNVRIYRELSMLNKERKSEYLNLNYELYFAINTNVDGFRLCTMGLDCITDIALRNKLISINQGNLDFSLYKANINGVDLNVNFDARWGTGKCNIKHKNYENFIGDKPNSEVETQNLIALTQKVKPDITISYHSKGEEIYYQFFQDEQMLLRDKSIAQVIAKTTKYAIKDISTTSAGGYKDYCIQHYNIPAYTIEVGNDSYSHPLGLEKLPTIFKQNKYVISNILKFLASGQQNL